MILRLFKYWNQFPKRLRMAILAVVGVYVALNVYTVVTTGEPLDFGLLKFIGLR